MSRSPSPVAAWPSCARGRGRRGLGRRLGRPCGTPLPPGSRVPPSPRPGWPTAGTWLRPSSRGRTSRPSARERGRSCPTSAITSWRAGCGSAVNLAALPREIAERDLRDSTRAVASLKPAPDSEVVGLHLAFTYRAGRQPGALENWVASATPGRNAPPTSIHAKMWSPPRRPAWMHGRNHHCLGLHGKRSSTCASHASIHTQRARSDPPGSRSEGA